MMIWWIFGALALIVVLLMGLLVTLRRSQRAVSSLALGMPATVPGLLANGPQVPAAQTGEDWRERALSAEALAEKQAKILGDKVGPELVEFAKETLVQGLYTQRNALLETQQRAQQALSELESRLAGLQLPQPERVQEYEKRIAELEKQLGNRNDEMRELTRATLTLLRRRLEQEKQEKPSESRRFN